MVSIDQIYPIGSVYITIEPTFDPNEAFEGTSWERFGAGRCLWGANEDNSNVGSEIEAGLPCNVTSAVTSID